MGVFDNLFGRKKATASSCCPCFNGAPSFHCRCHCHRVEDAEYWETVAYAWLCDALDERTREEAWHRFFQAYPEWATEEECGQFWDRIHRTRWHHKHHHDHYHEPYC